MRILLVEPPKKFWFLMGEYLPPPLGLLQLAAFLEAKEKGLEIEVLDCQAQGIDWRGLEQRVEACNPDIVASSGLSTCNAYIAAHVLEVAKKVNPGTLTVTGGQHFTALAQESLEEYPEIDVIVRGEGEQSFTDLVQAFKEKRSLAQVQGISYRQDGVIIHTSERVLIQDLDDLPMPGYHFVEDHIGKYHFTMMAGANNRYGLIEGSRGCPYRCTFCTQWRFWQGRRRVKTPRRIADEMRLCHERYGMNFLWLTDDNLGLGPHMNTLCDEILEHDFGDDFMWFIQARCDDVAKHKNLLPKMRRAGIQWMLLGVESPNKGTLEGLNKDLNPEDAETAVKALKENGIFAQATFIIGDRKDTPQSITAVTDFANHLETDLSLFMVLTPFPGTMLYETAKRENWIEDTNWMNYDMVHAIMPTEALTRLEVQEQLYDCYHRYYGSWAKRFKGLLSKNKLVRRTYRYLAGQALLTQLRNLF